MKQGFQLEVPVGLIVILMFGLIIIVAMVCGKSEPRTTLGAVGHFKILENGTVEHVHSAELVPSSVEMNALIDQLNACRMARDAGG